MIYLFWSQPHRYSWETLQTLMCSCRQIFQFYSYRLFFHNDHFSHFSLNEFIIFFNVITTFRNNNVNSWCVCTRWISKTIVGSIYIWKCVIRLQNDERYFKIFHSIQLNWWLEPCFEHSLIIAYYNWKRSLCFRIIFNLFKKILHFCKQKIIIVLIVSLIWYVKFVKLTSILTVVFYC